MMENGKKPFRNYKRPPVRAEEELHAPEREESYLEGRNAVSEALKAGRTLNKVFVAAGDTDMGLKRLAAQARDAGAVVVDDVPEGVVVAGVPAKVIKDAADTDAEKIQLVDLLRKL